MPFISMVTKKLIDKQHYLLVDLEGKLYGEKIEDEYVYILHDPMYSTQDGAPMCAVAELKNGDYVLYTPNYLEDKQLAILDFILKEVNEEDHIWVLTERDYNAVKKYTEGRNIWLKMYE